MVIFAGRTCSRTQLPCPINRVYMCRPEKYGSDCGLYDGRSKNKNLRRFAKLGFIWDGTGGQLNGSRVGSWEVIVFCV